MAQLDLTCSKLLALKDASKSLSSLCRNHPLPECPTLVSDLGDFYNAIVDISIVLFGQEYNSRTDVDHLTIQIEGAAHNAQLDIALLDKDIQYNISGHPVDYSRIKDLSYQVYKHTRTFAKLLDKTKGREDWSKLSLKVPSGVTKNQKGSLSPNTKSVSFDSSSLSAGSRSAPTSPYQPSVEEVPDTGEDEETHGVQEYHVDPPLFPQAESGASATQNPATERTTPSPPRVVLRTATDPKTLESQVHSLHFDDHDDVAQPPGVAEAWRNMGNPVRASPKSADMESSYHSVAASSKPSTRSIEDEISRLNEEIEKLKAAKSSKSSSSQRSTQSAYSIPPAKTYMEPPKTTGRTRAYTSTGAETRPTMRMPETDDPSRFGRPPLVSPRYSPTTQPSPRFGDRETRRPKPTHLNSEPMYGPGPNTSLPTFLESGTRPADRGVDPTQNKRASWAGPPDSYDPHQFSSYGPDPPLFSETPTSPKPRSPRNDSETLPPGVTQKKLPVTLEDMCLGASKKVRFKRRVPDAMGFRLIEDVRILTVQIYPGLKPGSRIKHAHEGDYDPATGQLGEVWFALDEQPHPTYERRDRDLHCTLSIPLADALCGWKRTVKSICGKDVTVRHKGVTPNGWKECFAGLGMPKYDRENRTVGGERGDLWVEVKVQLPPRELEEWQKDMIKRALGANPGRY